MLDEQQTSYIPVDLPKLRAQIIHLLGTLVEEGKITQNERVVIEKRFALNEDARHYRLLEVGKQIGVGRERVRQIQVKAIRRLRHRSPQFVDAINSYLLHVPYPKNGKEYWLTSEGFIASVSSQPLQEDADVDAQHVGQREDTTQDTPIETFLPRLARRKRKKALDVHSIHAYFRQQRPDE